MSSVKLTAMLSRGVGGSVRGGGWGMGGGGGGDELNQPVIVVTLFLLSAVGCPDITKLRGGWVQRDETMLQTGQNLTVAYQENIFLWIMTSHSIPENEERDIPSHILKLTHWIYVFLALTHRYVDYCIVSLLDRAGFNMQGICVEGINYLESCLMPKVCDSYE